MKTISMITLALTCLLVVAASPAVSQVPHLRIYFDEDLTVDAMDCPGQFIIDTLYVVAEEFDAWILAVEYEIDFPPEIIWLQDLSPFSVVIGTSPSGAAMGFEPLFGGEPLLVHRVVVMYNCTGDCPVENIPIRAIPNSRTGHMRAVRWPDMAYVDAVIDSTLGKGTYLCPSPPYRCEVYPTSIDFDSVFVGSTMDTTFTIKNTGTEALIDSVTEACAHYSIVSGGGPYNIAPGDSIVVQVRFEPGAEGSHNCAIDTGDDVCTNVSLSGYGEPLPLCEVSPTSIDFGTIFVGAAKDTTFVIKNAGGGTIDGTVTETCAYYSIVSDSVYSLAADESVFVTVRFGPMEEDTFECWIETGTVLCDSVYCIGVAIEPPVCLVEPDTLDFGSVAVGDSRDLLFKIKNTGGSILEGTVSETCAYYSIVSDSVYSLAADESVLVTVRFEPLAGGTFECWIETGAALCDSVYCIGDAFEPPACLVEPDTLDFGTIFVGATKDTTFMIKNTGGGTIDGTVTEACAYYSIVSDSVYSLADDESVFVTVRFEPLAEGTFTCRVETGAALCDSVYCIGDAVLAPVCLVDPDTLDFGSVAVGNWSELVFEIKNTGGSTLDGTVTEACAHFSIVSDSVYSLAAGESLLVTIRYSPSAEGVHNCTIETGQGICADVFATGQSTPEPLITSIVDVGNDQGRWVRIYFDRSSRDIVGSPTPILQYEAFRRVDPLPSPPPPAVVAAAVGPDREMHSDPAILSAGWEFAGAIPAHVEPDYIMIAPTLADSTISHGMYYSVFFIRAATAEPAVFFDSPVDSGYSLDNLAPGVPQGFMVAYNAPGGNQLTWDLSEDVDLQYFKVYRSTDPNFTPAPQDLVHSTADVTWVDPVGQGYLYSYKIAATDFSGNESDPTGPEVTTGTDGGFVVPSAYTVRQCVPNPFNPRTMIEYGVPAGGGNVTIKVYDVRGRRVRTLVDSWQAEGWKSVTWNATDESGRRVASGVYFYRMTAPGFAETRKMVLLQ